MILLRTGLALVIAFCLATGAHIVNAMVRPLSGDERVASQVRFLTDAISDGAAQQMQDLFPEGEFFTQALTGLAAARLGDRAGVERALQAIEIPGVRDRFGAVAALDGGTFYRGWRLLLWAERDRLWQRDPAPLVAEARVLGEALLADPQGVPESYPGGRWPCDAVVAMAAVIAAYEVAGQAPPTSMIEAWRSRLDTIRDPGTNLLPHRITGTQSVTAEPPRSSSQAVIQTFWPRIDPAGATEQWDTYVRLFVVREAGLVGIREFRQGDDSPGDVDSGPLVLGVSLSASAVTLGAARANGDLALATALDRQAELLGIPLEWDGQRRFALGLLPVGDAFVAWARTVPFRDAAAQPVSQAPEPLWWPYVAAVAVVAAAAGLLFVQSVHRAREQEWDADDAWDEPTTDRPRRARPALWARLTSGHEQVRDGRRRVPRQDLLGRRPRRGI